MTVAWHVDDLKMSHKSPAIVTDIIKWLRGIYRELCILCGQNHEYLGIDIDYLLGTWQGDFQHGEIHR